MRTALCRYPAGFDLFLICGAQVIGLPRSTTIEVL
jgi:alpha-D-ribose 1-methylphosphonate 5-triphosphate synthase subunit PhnH